jgi:hypothetical protein
MAWKKLWDICSCSQRAFCREVLQAVRQAVRKMVENGIDASGAEIFYQV